MITEVSLFTAAAFLFAVALAMYAFISWLDRQTERTIIYAVLAALLVVIALSLAGILR